jgi:hypothetical protein
MGGLAKKPTSAVHHASASTATLNLAPKPKPRKPASPAVGTSPDDSKDAHVSPALKQRVEQLISAAERNAQQVNDRLADVEQVDDVELRRFADVLLEHRDNLQSLLINLPSGGILQQRVHAAARHVTAELERVETVARAHEGRRLTSRDSVAEGKAVAFREAADRVQGGFCDSAPQGHSPCELDEPTRDRYRRRVRDVAVQMQNSWTAAINAVKVEEKLKKEEVPFSRIFGELVLAILTDGLSLAMKAAVSKGLDVAEKAMTKVEHIRVPGAEFDSIVSAPDMGIAREIGDKVSAQAAKKLMAPIHASELQSRTMDGIVVPDNRDQFLQIMKTAPGKWYANVVGSVDQLFDADLAALVAGLPSLDEINQLVYEEKVRHLLKRYDDQVLAIEPLSQTTVTMVALPNGTIRQALIYPEKQPDAKLRGEWKNSPVNTGKWTFVRWIDEDMREMSVTRAVEKDKDASAAGRVKFSGDGHFWDDKSLEAFRTASMED